MKEQDAIATKLAILSCWRTGQHSQEVSFNPAKMVETQKKVTKLFKQSKFNLRRRDAKLADAEQALELSRS